MPALVWRGRDDGRILLTLHGGGDSKDVVGPNTVARVLDAGVTLVAADLYLHGEHFDEHSATVGKNALDEIVRHTAHELDAAVDDLGGAVAVRGESLGAFVVLTALASGARFTAALAIAGIPLVKPKSVSPCPLLMINGIRDKHVPVAKARAFHAALATSDDCLLLTHGGGHETPTALDDLAWSWLLPRV